MSKYSLDTPRGSDIKLSNNGAYEQDTIPADPDLLLSHMREMGGAALTASSAYLEPTEPLAREYGHLDALYGRISALHDAEYFADQDVDALNALLDGMLSPINRTGLLFRYPALEVVPLLYVEARGSTADSTLAMLDNYRSELYYHLRKKGHQVSILSGEKIGVGQDFLKERSACIEYRPNATFAHVPPQELITRIGYDQQHQIEKYALYLRVKQS
jgi:hypothetical protein